MPTLDFKGKSFVYTHHLSVPFRELIVDAKKSELPAGMKPSLEGNLIIHGDNLHALKALLPIYAGKVDCIYIDPPYNTGNEGWCYNDNVRSPLMKEWLKKSANPVEKDDLERHEKWLCMMWPRLKLLHELLAEDGAIFISIDDNELHRLRDVMDEIFGEANFVVCLSVKSNPRGRQSDEYVASLHEYCLCYAKKIEWLELNGLPLTSEDIAEFDQEDADGGKWRELGLRQRGSGSLREDRPDMFFPIFVNPDDGSVSLSKTSKHTEIVEPRKSDGRDSRWMWSPEKVEAEKNRVYGRKVSRRDEFDIFIKDYLDRNGEQRTAKPRSMWYDSEVNTELGGKLLKAILGSKEFDYPKPLGLIERLLRIGTSKRSLVLDSFAGSATTAHAVLAANKQDGGNRKFILIEMEDYADKLTAERVRRVIEGYKFKGTQREELLREPLTWTKLKKAAELVEKADSFDLLEKHRFDHIAKSVEDGALVVTGEKKITEKVAGLGGSFTFCTLGEEMSMERLLAGDKLPSFDALAKYVFYTATGRTLADVPKQKADGDGFIGETEFYRVHLYYQPEKKWLASNEAALTEQLVEKMRASNQEKKRLLVFAAAKFMAQKELTRQGVEFCQLPYAIHRILGD
jgi:adenine-specific DNA-methyltransferase